MSKRVLFVCMGNICRSPTGEGLLRQLIAEHDLEAQVEVDSAGTIGYHTGSPPDPRMSLSARRRGYRLSGRARQIEPSDFARFDLIVAMDRDNLADIRAFADDRQQGSRDGAEIRLLSSFLPEGGAIDVPDPYYGGEEGFMTVIDMIEEACSAILDYLLESRSP